MARPRTDASHNLRSIVQHAALDYELVDAGAAAEHDSPPEPDYVKQPRRPGGESMSDPVEVELKLEYDPADGNRLVASSLLGSSGGEAKHLVATYFDTPDLQLDQAGYALRIRKEGRRRLQTVKAGSSLAAGLFVRGEWERPVKGDQPLLDARAGPLGERMNEATLAKIAPIFITDVERRSGTIERPEGGLIEYAIDMGEVRAGARSMPLSEIELELKQGSPRALFDLARALNEEVPLRLGVRSKSDRGYALVENKIARAAEAEPIRIDREASAAAAFSEIAGSCIRHYRLNESLLLQSGAAEPVHQARVALRRLRSAFSLFRPLFAGDDRAAELAGELRWLARELGNIRDIDVLLPAVEGEARASLTAVRKNHFETFVKLLAGRRVRLLPIELVEWLAVGRWRRLQWADSGPSGCNIVPFAAERLDRLFKRIRREGANLARSDDEHRHQVRKDAKKLRYAAEFFVSLHPGRKPRRRLDALLGSVEALQDRLDRLNDAAAAPELLSRLGLRIDTPKLGRKERARLLDEAQECFEALIDAKRFWRA